jgi:hypothetical protein
VADPVDRAITYFENGDVEKAARLLAVTRRSALDSSHQRLAQIDDAIGQMQAHLSGEDREGFDQVLQAEVPTSRVRMHSTLEAGRPWFLRLGRTGLLAVAVVIGVPMALGVMFLLFAVIYSLVTGEGCCG